MHWYKTDANNVIVGYVFTEENQESNGYFQVEASLHDEITALEKLIIGDYPPKALCIIENKCATLELGIEDTVTE